VKSLTDKDRPIITDDAEVLPNGRGRTVVILHRRVLPKPKKEKGAKSLLLFAVKLHNGSMTLKLYVSDKPKRYVLFTDKEGKIIQYEERLKMASALIASLQKDSSVSPFLEKTKKAHKPSIRGLFSSELRHESKRQVLRIRNFVRRNEK
jgi:hypothetical protein